MIRINSQFIKLLLESHNKPDVARSGAQPLPLTSLLHQPEWALIPSSVPSPAPPGGRDCLHYTLQGGSRQGKVRLQAFTLRRKWPLCPVGLCFLTLLRLRLSERDEGGHHRKARLHSLSGIKRSLPSS